VDRVAKDLGIVASENRRGTRAGLQRVGPTTHPLDTRVGRVFAMFDPLTRLEMHMAPAPSLETVQDERDCAIALRMDRHASRRSTTRSISLTRSSCSRNRDAPGQPNVELVVLHDEEHAPSVVRVPNVAS
jgi:hypothetical protein